MIDWFTARTTAPLAQPDPPVYPKPTKPGLYLVLEHGRWDLHENMQEMGFDGPMLGPLEWYHCTYGSTHNIEYVDVCDEHDQFGEAGRPYPEYTSPIDLDGCDGMLLYNGAYYGDWTLQCYKDVTENERNEHGTTE